MQWTYIFFLLCTYAFLPFSFAHSTDPKTGLQSCQNLDRLDKTVQRVSPILDRIVRTHEAKHNSTGHHGHGHSHDHNNHHARDLDDWVKKIQSVQEMLGQSQEKIYHKKLNCSDIHLSSTATPHVPRSPRSPRMESFSKRSDCDDDEEQGDDDDDDDRCTLVDVLDSLVDTLECLLEFAVGLLEPILDLVFKLVSSILEGVSNLLD